MRTHTGAWLIISVIVPFHLNAYTHWSLVNHFSYCSLSSVSLLRFINVAIEISGDDKSSDDELPSEGDVISSPDVSDVSSDDDDDDGESDQEDGDERPGTSGDTNGESVVDGDIAPAPNSLADVISNVVEKG
jgi:hypothetical protein